MNASVTAALVSLAHAHGCAVLENEPLCRHTTFRIGGPARLFVEVRSARALGALRAACRKATFPCFMLGNGSNLIAPDEGWDGVILHPAAPELTVLRQEGNDVIAGAGLRLSTLTAFARDCGLTGLEFAYGIPGSVGGAAYMNAGAYGGEIGAVLSSCDCITAEGEPCTVPAAELKLGYRHTVFMETGAAVTAVRVQLAPDTPDAISARMEDYMARRRAKQPLEYPSAGSVFRRPAGHFAGGLIEQCGLKGCTIGGAQVSEKHAGFIVNRGGATAQEVLALIEHIQQVVLRETGVSLECEVLRLSN